MTVDDIFSEWERDRVIDRIDLGGSLLDIAEKRTKYLRILHDERTILRQLERQHLRLTALRTDYYKGDLNGSDVLKELGWESFRGVVLKENLRSKVESDPLVIKMAEQVGAQHEKVSVVTGIIDSIKSLSFDIRGAIEWQKYLSGA